MKHLYAFSMCGKTLFFGGTIPEEKFDEIEKIANEIDRRITIDEYVLRLVEATWDKLKIRLDYYPIEYVFRVRRNDGYHVE